MNDKLTVSICIPAYNEGGNILHILESLRNQQTDRILIREIVVVSSGSTDNTDELVGNYCDIHPQFKLIIQKNRNGKASAINEFLKHSTDEVIVIESADTIPMSDTIEELCKPFILDTKIGMTGGAPIPVNDPNTFLGYIIHAWWWFHRHIPRFGEIIAYRNIFDKISDSTAVDEAFIQARMVQLGYKVVHIDSAVVYNKGPETVSDLVKQRRRIFNGHARLFNEEKVKINNMTISSLKLMLFKFKINSIQQLIWFVSGIAIEIYARILGAHDQYIKKLNPYIWDTAHSTKKLKKLENLNKKIVFLNFAPIQFMGGAERWMLDVANSIGEHAETWLVDVHPSLANHYGRIVLGRKYESRIKAEDGPLPKNHLSIRLSAFVPGTMKWKQIRRIIKEADSIYFRYELLEVFLILYFGGPTTLKKSIAGVHSPFLYNCPKSMLDRLHNLVYSSFISQIILRNVMIVHVLNKNLLDCLKAKFKLDNVVLIPNYSSMPALVRIDPENNSDRLNVVYVGELSLRKGADSLLDVINAADSNIMFYVAGDGQMRREILEAATKSNVKYLGHIGRSELRELYMQGDVFFMPSRAESLSLASLDAIMHGLPIISSQHVDMGLPNRYQLINSDSSIEGYLKLLQHVFDEKKAKKLVFKKIKIFEFSSKEYSKTTVLSKLHNLFLNL